MEQIEKTVFISYRRTNASWALAIFQYLTQHGYDVFFDFNGIASGDFERVILQNIAARAHFLVLLTPSALERCGEPSDLFRLEVETALAHQRNIVPLMLEGFAFSSPSIANQLVGSLEPLKRYNAIVIPTEYFIEAMARLREKFLNIPLTAVLHPLSATTERIVSDQKAAAVTASVVTEDELTAQSWYERGVSCSNPEEQIRYYDEAIRLNPSFAVAFNNRGLARFTTNDFERAIVDLTEAIRLDPQLHPSLFNRGAAYARRGDLSRAVADFDRKISLDPGFAPAYNWRGACRMSAGDLKGSIEDFDRAVQLDPDLDEAVQNRISARTKLGTYKGTLGDLITLGVRGFKRGLNSPNTK